MVGITSQALSVDVDAAPSTHHPIDPPVFVELIYGVEAIPTPKSEEIEGFLEPLPPIEQIICSQPWPCQKAIAVANCESRLNSRAYNASGPFYGLFQISSIHAGMVGGDPTRFYDPATNAHVAYELYRSGGWRAWPICQYH